MEESPQHDCGRLQVHRRTKSCEVNMWKWIVVNVLVGGGVVRSFSRGFSFSDPGSRYTRKVFQKPSGNNLFDLFRSIYTAVSFLRSSKHIFLRVKKYGVALPETIEKTLFSFGGVDARGGRSSAGLTVFAACVRAMCLALRPDPQHGVRSGNQCCNQNWCQQRQIQKK